MRLNVLPFLFLPGTVLIGYLVNEWSGVVWALALWSGPVLLGTALTVRRHIADAARRRGDASPDCVAPPPERLF